MTDEFCPSLPDPYEGLLREYGQKVRRYTNIKSFGDDDFVATANHAAAEAEHALRAALLTVLPRG
jgi:hypothetical protein